MQSQLIFSNISIANIALTVDYASLLVYITANLQIDCASCVRVTVAAAAG